MEGEKLKPCNKMQNPILKNIRSILVYTVIWLLVSTFYCVFIYLKFDYYISDCIIISVIFNFLFALIGIAVWYAVLYSFPEKTGILNLIINHVTAAIFLIFLWNVAALFFVKIFTNEYLYKFILKHLFWYNNFGIVYYILLVLIYYLIIYNNNLMERKKNEDRLIAIIKETELNLLKSQINPHFLFNSLNSISSLTITNPAKAQEMIIQLSDFLRYSISRHTNQISTLKNELENIQRYIDIEKIRFGDRFEYRSDISPDCYNKTLPTLILQPLYENAIKHGVYESTDTITLQTKVCMENNFMVITITNNYDPDMSAKKGSGIGLKNIRERLILTYHTEGLIQIIKSKNNFEVKLYIPQNI